MIVGLFLESKKKSAVVKWDKLPNQGDVLGLNNRFYNVDRVVHNYTEHNGKISSLTPCLFLSELTEEESKTYNTDQYKWDRDDTLNHFA